MADSDDEYVFDEAIDCRFDAIKRLVPRTEFVRKR